MKALSALIATIALLAVAWIGVGVAGQTYLFGVVIPYAAMATFLVGLVYRILRWAAAPVPYRITTTCGQQQSLPWIKANRLENPPNAWWAAGRVALEVLLFRSLFRNTKVALTPSRHLTYESTKLLWAGALLFHYSFLVIFLRHLRFFVEPAPAATALLERVDGFFQLASPALFLSDVLILAALLFLLGRRLVDARMRYLSLPADYFALFLLLGVAGSGVLMRYVTKVDLVAAKELALGLVALHPVAPPDIGLPFYVHVFFVSVLFAYFPFSKLMHMGGVFLSPTRNLPNDNRRHRHVNPLNPEVEPHTYEQWEDEFRDKLLAAGIPVERG
jgi:[DsrC]-trisulfide reductase subunit M